MEFRNMRAFALGILPLSGLDALREVIRQFTPNWFAATMGTGILSIALSQTPLRPVGEVLWLFNIGLFALFSALYTARWLFFFDGARRIFDHPVMSMFLGCIPMGLATIANGFLIYRGAVGFAETLWWIDTALAIACGVAVPYLMFTRQNHSVEQMTAVWLLPVVAAEVAAVSGGLIAPHAERGVLVLWMSYTLWALSVPIAMSVLVVLVLRLAVHKLPHVSMAASAWLALGPIGTGALGLMTLGDAAPVVLSGTGLGGFAATAQGAGLLGGMVLWGYGLWWFAMAGLMTLRYAREGVPFNLGWWGYTFPLGVYAVATMKLGDALPIPLIGLLGQALVALLAMVWTVVALRTAFDAWHGTLFHAPCLHRAD